MNPYYLHHVIADYVLHHLLLDQVNKLASAFKDTHIRVEHQSYYREGALSLWIHSHNLPSEEGEIVIEIVGDTERLSTISAVLEFLIQFVTEGEVLSHEGTAITIIGIGSSSAKKKPFAHATKSITTIKYSVSLASSTDDVKLPTITQHHALRFVRDFRRSVHARCNNEALLFVGRSGYPNHPGRLFLSDWADFSEPGALSAGVMVLYQTDDKVEGRAATDIQASLESEVVSIVIGDSAYQKQITERLPPSVNTWGVKGISSKGLRFTVYV